MFTSGYDYGLIEVVQAGRTTMTGMMFSMSPQSWLGNGMVYCIIGFITLLY
jgi:hypothetical protein